MIGDQISHYRVVETIGEGGMGVVYLAEDLMLGRQVALKTLPKQFSLDPGRRRRFTIEARAAAALNHPGIAAIYELIEDGDDLYIAMELVRGASLRDCITLPPIPLEEMLEIALQITAGLVAAHEKSIVHRDLKPENILRTADQEIKILDFGLAKLTPVLGDALTQSGNPTGSGVFVGTIAYMSPEQLEGKRSDARSDIFSLGVIMYELATGAHPFGGSSAASTIANILNREPVPLAQHRVIVPSELERIIDKCLQKDPRHRYSSALELRADLAALRAALKNPGSPLLDKRRPEETIVRRALDPIGPSPRRWWEVNQYICLAAFPTLAYWIWRVRDWLPQEWAVLAFFMMVIMVACSMTMRLYLLMMSGFDPLNLHAEAVRWATAIRVTTFGIWIMLGLVAAVIVREHVGIGSLMGGLAVGGTISTLVAESAINANAFPGR